MIGERLKKGCVDPYILEIQSIQVLVWSNSYNSYSIYVYRNKEDCSETTLTGESQFHISIPWRFEPGSLVTGSKQVDHWTSEIAGSPQGSPPAADSVGCESGGRN